MLEPERQRQERKDLAASLKSLRKAADLSGQRLADRCAISQSKISRIESGQTLPSVIDVQRILSALDVPDEVASELLNLARVANVHYKSWRAYAQIGLWRNQAELKALAESSTVVRQFLPAIPSGLIQSESYAKQVLTPTVPGDVSWNAERAVRARMESQEALRDESRRFVFLMPEHAIRWQRVDQEIMGQQCAHMAEVAQRPNVDIAIIPQTAKVRASPLHVFVVYDDRLVMIELFSGEILLRDPRDVSYHLDLFSFFLDHAITGDDATAFLRSAADEFMREQE